MVQPRIVQNEPRVKCRYCWRSWAALYRLSTGEERTGWQALESHVVDHMDDRTLQHVKGCPRCAKGTYCRTACLLLDAAAHRGGPRMPGAVTTTTVSSLAQQGREDQCQRRRPA